MVNTIDEQIIEEGDRNVVLKYTIVGDGSGEETDTVLVDKSSLSGTFTDFKLDSVYSVQNGFTSVLSWDATSNVLAVALPDQVLDFNRRDGFGGIPNDSGAGKTGDLLISTAGLGAGDKGHIILGLRKRL